MSPAAAIIGRGRYRTWSIFSIALCSVLGLMLVPTFTALRESRQIHEQIRTMQAEQKRVHRLLDDISIGLYSVSILIREFLLDTGPAGPRDYSSQFDTLRSHIQAQMERLQDDRDSGAAAAIRQLRGLTEDYWRSLEPVFTWAPAQRAARASYFLSQEQRPRRESLLAMAANIRRVNDAFYARQFDLLQETENAFRRKVTRVTAFAVVAGLMIASACVLRIYWLERRFLEQHLRARRSGEEMRVLSMRLRHAQEEERKSIARELHDDVGQKLTALRMELGTLDRLRYTETAQFAENLADVKRLAEQCMRSIRDMAAGLRPSVLDDLGIGPALQRHAREVSRHTGIPVTVDLSGPLDHLPEQLKVYLFRIVQEGLTNCAKHARASRISVSVTAGTGAIAVCIADDGVGFVPSQSTHSGTGLIGIEERVRELDGTMEIESDPGKGTRLRVRFPLHGGGK